MMHDQASDLRELVRQGAGPARTAPWSRPKLLVLTGGQGGVGTTTVAVNLAVALARQRHPTALVDADPQGGDAAQLCRVQPRSTLADVLEGRRTVNEVLQPGPAGLQVLSAAQAPGSVGEASGAAHQRLIGQLQGLGREIEFIVVDAGNGLHGLTRRFWHAADMVLLVTTPDPASVMDAYASVKVMASTGDSIWIHTLVNMASGWSEARQVHIRLAQACLRFLALQASGVGYVASDPQAAAAGRAGEPFVTRTPRCRSTRRIRRLAKTVIRRMKRSAITA